MAIRGATSRPRKRAFSLSNHTSSSSNSNSLLLLTSTPCSPDIASNLPKLNSRAPASPSVSNNRNSTAANPSPALTFRLSIGTRRLPIEPKALVAWVRILVYSLTQATRQDRSLKRRKRTYPVSTLDLALSSQCHLCLNRTPPSISLNQPPLIRTAPRLPLLSARRRPRVALGPSSSLISLLGVRCRQLPLPRQAPLSGQPQSSNRVINKNPTGSILTLLLRLDLESTAREASEEGRERLAWVRGGWSARWTLQTASNRQ